MARSQASLWLRETATLAGRYVLIGFAMVPAGCVYGFWATNHGPSAVAMAICLLSGLVTAALVWRLCEPNVLQDLPLPEFTQNGIITAYTMIHLDLSSIEENLEVLIPQGASQTESGWMLLEYSGTAKKEPYAG